MSNISDFIAEIKTQGLARTNRFAVMFSTPNNENPAALKKAMLFCDQVQLPGMSYGTTQNRTFGESREVPYERLFDQCQISFHVDRDMKIKQIFDDWMMAIQNPITRTFNYYNEYTTTMSIEVQDIANNTRYEVTLYEVYPKSMSQIQLDTSSKDTMKLQVTFQYKYWISSTIEEIPSGQKISTNLIDKFRDNFTGFQERLNKGLGEAGNFVTGAVVQTGMRAFSQVTSKLPNIRF